MYHVSDDKRSKKSAQLIWEGMEKCLQEKSLDKLRITDINQTSYVSRATFYRLFDSLQDVLVYQCDCIYTRLAERLDRSLFQSKKDFFLSLITEWMDQEILVKTLVENGMVNIIYNTHMKNADFMKRIFLEDTALSEREADYLISILANIIPAALNVWYFHGKKEPPEEIYQAVSKSLNIIGQKLIM